MNEPFSFDSTPPPLPPPVANWFDPIPFDQPPSLPIASRYIPPVDLNPVPPPLPIPVAYPPRRPVRPTVIAPPPPPIVRPATRSRRDDWDEDHYERAYRVRRARRLPSIVPLMLSVAVFAGMMCVSFGQGLIDLLAEPPSLKVTDEQLYADLVNQTLAFEGLDTVIVLFGIAVAGRPLARAAAGHVGVTWVLAAPGFVVLLGVNIAYSVVVQLVFRMQVGPETPNVQIDLAHGALWAILLVCVQPALIEELFFRYLFLGHLRQHLGLHASVWITAVLFGMAHLGNIPGWPVLILLGAGLGYARVYSGGIALPIALHFLHNFAVLSIAELAR